MPAQFTSTSDQPNDGTRTFTNNPNATVTQSPTPPFTDDNAQIEANDLSNELFATIAQAGEEQDFDAAYQPAGDVGVWNDYNISTVYEKDYGRYMMGITSPDGFNGDSVAFVQLKSPTLLLLASWTASKYGAKPVLPNAELTDPNWVLLDEQHSPVMLSVAGDSATPLYEYSGVYVYGHRRPSSLTFTDIQFSRPPFLQDIFDRTLSAADFQPTLIRIE